MEKKLDISLSENRALFLHVKAQSDLVLDIFQELASSFSQEYLLTIHPGSKGTKVSKGFRLEGCPYEVLDIVRDFDPITGFNVRILQWWGHGSYIFWLLGTESAEKWKWKIQSLEGYHVSTFPNPWDYKNILQPEFQASPGEFENFRSNSGFFQFFKKIEQKEAPNLFLNQLKSEILLIFDNEN